MIPALIRWSVDNRLVVTLLAVVLAGVGTYSFTNINVEAYPDPAPAIVEIIAEFPSASAEEVERQVTIPLEVALQGMPGLRYTRTKSLFGLSHVRNQFEYDVDYNRAKLEVLNRLSFAVLPSGVRPQIAPTSPTGEIYRYTLTNPVDDAGRPIYALHDLKSLEDYTLEREFRRVPRIADVVSFGGEVKRYEIQPDPDRLRQFGIGLDDLEQSVAQCNANVGGDYLVRSQTVQVVRGLGLLGQGEDPMVAVFGMDEPRSAQQYLRDEETRRLREIRQVVLASTNNVPIRVGDVVDGGRRPVGIDFDSGTVVGRHTRMGRVTVAKPKLDAEGREIIDQNGGRLWNENEDAIEGIILLRKGEQSLPALADVKEKVRQLNEIPGQLPPGIKLDTFYDRTRLINRTTETVRENLFVGLALVTAVLLVFLNHVPSTLIVALNIPLALLFAFTMLYFRGKSANLLSLGAVDFGIIVDSSVIMVEAIYRRLSAGEDADQPLVSRIIRATDEVQRSLLFSTMIMVCALLPLFTMNGPEGQIFGPMADAYAFALGGALVLALTLSPVLCRLFMSRVKERRDNWIVRGIRGFYLHQLDWALNHRILLLGAFALMLVGTTAMLPLLGREFMPALEEGNIYIRGTFPANVSLNEVAERTRVVRHALQDYPEVAAVLSQLGRPDDGTDPTSFYNAEIFVSLKSQEEWPETPERHGLERLFGSRRRRSKAEIVESMNVELDRLVIGVDWNFSQGIRDNVMETLSGVKGENSIKIIGPNLHELERLAAAAAAELEQVPGIENVGVFSIVGQTNLEFAVDRDKCAAWNVSVDDVQNALQTAVGGKSFTQMIEGERSFDVTLRWPARLRSDENTILDIPVEVVKNRLVDGASPLGVSSSGTSRDGPSATGTVFESLGEPIPRRRLRDLVTPLDESGRRDPDGTFLRAGASTIYREQGRRLIAVKFSVRGRDLAGAVAEAQAKTAHLFESPYRVEWSGEFQEMQEAVQRLLVVVSLALVVILVLLYLALRSLADVMVVFVNVLVICMGGIWALLLTGQNFNISAGVGFISILGVGMMNGLILVSGFNARRIQGMPLREAIADGVSKRVRPLTMTVLTAIFGMLPAALSTKIGSETQRPLAIVVVGGMGMTLLLLNLIPILYSLYGDRDPIRRTTADGIH